MNYLIELIDTEEEEITNNLWQNHKNKETLDKSLI